VEIPVDRARLRKGRLERLQATMRAQDVEACLLFNDPNVRYATGASAMPTEQHDCAAPWFPPRTADPARLPERDASLPWIEAEVRPMHAWEFYDDGRTAIFARQTVAARGSSALEPSSTGWGRPGFALQHEGMRSSTGTGHDRPEIRRLGNPPLD
jgi:Xaa-Pro aminopeptidase